MAKAGPEWNTIMAPRKTAMPVRMALVWWTHNVTDG